MPFSSNSGKQFIKSLNLKANTVLDIGAGSGTYRNLLPNIGKHWTAVEVWEPYVTQYNLNDKYDRVIIQDAREFEFDQRYDLCFAGDVLEHMTEQESKELLAKLRANCDTVVVSIPIGYYPQDAYNGNPYEKHVEDNWSVERALQAFGDPRHVHVEQEIAVFVYRKLKICVYAISKNEEMFVERFMKSAELADMVLIADTGSTDRTVDLARNLGAIVPEICITPWRFDKARDTALAMIPRDMDVCISLDLDEMMEPGWRDEIERLWKYNTTRLRYKFDWGCGIAFYYEKIHARHGYHWHHPCHEYPRADARIQEVYAYTDMLMVSHHPDPTKSRGQYLDLLKLSVTEDPRCPRNAFYYARELTFYHKWVDAVVALNKYLDNPDATWPNERCYAMRLLGKSYEALKSPNEALEWYRKATKEAPNTREPWVELAELCYKHKMWDESLAACESALRITDKALVYTMDPSVWGSKPYDFAAIAAWNLNLREKAIEYGEKAVELDPNDLRLVANLEYYKLDK